MIQSSPDELKALQAAQQAWNAGQLKKALLELEQALSRSPDSIPIRLMYGNAQASRYELTTAEAQFGRAFELAEGDPHALIEIARCWGKHQRINQAIEVLESVPVESRPAVLEGMLAVYYEQLGRFDDAEEAVNRCLDQNDAVVEPNLVLARILAHQGHYERSLRLLESLKGSEALRDAKLQIRFLYQVAQVLDRLGAFEQAFELALQAKAIQKKVPRAEQLAKGMLQRLSGLVTLHRQMDATLVSSLLSRELPAAPSAEGCRSTHLIGFPRSGTTLLESMLDAHPELVTSSESLVFANEIFPPLARAAATNLAAGIQSTSADRLAELREAYWGYLRAAHGGAWEGSCHLDKKPANLMALFALLWLFPEAKFLVAIRDPRDVILSCFLRFYPLGDLSSCFLSLGTTVLAYTETMQIWMLMRELLPQAMWHEVRYESVIDDHRAQADQAIAFLGLEPHENTSNYLATNPHRPVSSPTFAEVRGPISDSRVGRWKNYRRQLEGYLPRLLPYLEAFDYE